MHTIRVSRSALFPKSGHAFTGEAKIPRSSGLEKPAFGYLVPAGGSTFGE